jgi:hypothetical protein
VTNYYHFPNSLNNPERKTGIKKRGDKQDMNLMGFPFHFHSRLIVIQVVEVMVALVVGSDVMALFVMSVPFLTLITPSRFCPDFSGASLEMFEVVT